MLDSFSKLSLVGGLTMVGAMLSNYKWEASPDKKMFATRKCYFKLVKWYFQLVNAILNL
jgi:hypothetical protein